MISQSRPGNDGSPRPEPPYRRVMEESALVEGLEQAGANCSGEMPMPVSLTAM